jgi:hypothetical protein
MSDPQPNQSEPKNIAGGCSMGCASLFVLVGVVWPLLAALGDTLDENVMWPSMMIGLPSFIIAHALALVGVFSHVATARQWGRRAVLMMWGSIAAAVLIGLVVPDPPAPSVQEVVGIYDGTYQGITEVLELRNDETFVQELALPSGDKMTANGTWKLNTKTVTLNQYLVFFDGINNGPQMPPQKYSYMTYSYNAGSLIRDWHSGNYTSKRR